MSQIARVLSNWAIYIFFRPSKALLHLNSAAKNTLSKYPAYFLAITNHANICPFVLQTAQYINRYGFQNEYRRYCKLHKTAFHASQKTAISYHTIELLTSDDDYKLFTWVSWLAFFVLTSWIFPPWKLIFCSWLVEGLPALQVKKSWRVFFKRFVFDW